MSEPKDKEWPLFLVKGSVEVRVEVSAEMIVKARNWVEALNKSYDVSKLHPRRVVLDEAAVLEAVLAAPFLGEVADMV